MLTVDLDQFMIEIKDGAIKNVGASNKSATVKLYEVADGEAREYGSDRVKLAFEDDEGNGVEVALGEAAAWELADELDALRPESPE